nr:unnamed protein product [Callosobruchus chinensis]
MMISDELKSDINCWIENLAINKNELTHDKYILKIFSDAYDSGWGIYCDKISSNGSWSSHEKNEHINYKELLALFFGLKCFAAKLTNASVLCRVDTTTAKSYVNRIGNVQFPKLNSLARRIWQ